MDSCAPRCQSLKGFGKRAAHPRPISLGVWLYNHIWERQTLLQSVPGSVGADAAPKWPLWGAGLGKGYQDPV